MASNSDPLPRQTGARLSFEGTVTLKILSSPGFQHIKTELLNDNCDDEHIDDLVHSLVKHPRGCRELRETLFRLHVHNKYVSVTFLRRLLENENKFCAQLFQRLVYSKFKYLPHEKANPKDPQHPSPSPTMMSSGQITGALHAGQKHNPVLRAWKQQVWRCREVRGDIALMRAFPRTCFGTKHEGPDNAAHLLPLQKHECGWRERFTGVCASEADWGICLVRNPCDPKLVRALANTPNEDVFETEFAAAVVVHKWKDVQLFHIAEVILKVLVIIMQIVLAVHVRYDNLVPWFMVFVLFFMSVKEGLGECAQVWECIKHEIEDEKDFHRRHKRANERTEAARDDSIDPDEALLMGANMMVSRVNTFLAGIEGVRVYLCSASTLVDLTQLLLRILCASTLRHYQGSVSHKAIVGMMCAGEWIQCLYLFRGFQPFGVRLLPIIMAMKDTLVFGIVVFCCFAALTHFYYVVGITDDHGAVYGSLLMILRLGLVGDFDIYEIEGYDGQFELDPSTNMIYEQDPEPSQYYYVAHLIFWITLIFMNVILMNLLVGILGHNFDLYEENALPLVLREKAELICAYESSLLVAATRKIYNYLTAKLQPDLEDGPGMEREVKHRGDKEHECLWVAFRRKKPQKQSDESSDEEVKEVDVMDPDFHRGKVSDPRAEALISSTSPKSDCSVATLRRASHKFAQRKLKVHSTAVKLIAGSAQRANSKGLGEARAPCCTNCGHPQTSEPRASSSRSRSQSSGASNGNVDDGGDLRGQNFHQQAQQAHPTHPQEHLIRAAEQLRGPHSQQHDHSHHRSHHYPDHNHPFDNFPSPPSHSAPSTPPSRQQQQQQQQQPPPPPPSVSILRARSQTQLRTHTQARQRSMPGRSEGEGAPGRSDRPPTGSQPPRSRWKETATFEMDEPAQEVQVRFDPQPRSRSPQASGPPTGSSGVRKDLVDMHWRRGLARSLHQKLSSREAPDFVDCDGLFWLAKKCNYAGDVDTFAAEFVELCLLYGANAQEGIALPQFLVMLEHQGGNLSLSTEEIKFLLDELQRSPIMETE